MGLERDQDLSGRTQGVQRQDAERRGTIHQDVVKLFGVGIELIAEDHFSTHGPEELKLRAGEIDMAAANEEVRGDLSADLGEGQVVGEDLIERRPGTAGQEPEVQGCVGLWVEVEDQGLVALLRERGGEVDRGGRLSHPTLLVQHGDPSHRVSFP